MLDICTVGGDQTSLTVGDAVVFSDGVSLLEAVGVGWFRHALDCVPASNGGLFEPGQGLSRDHACEYSRLLYATDV